MAGFAFRKNSTFDWNGVTFRVREIPPNDELLIEAVSTGAMSVVPRAQLLMEFAEGRLGATPAHLAPTANAKVFSRPLDELPEKVRAEATRRLHYLRAIEAEGTPIFTRAYLDPILKRVCTDIGDAAPPSPSTFYRWYRRHLSTGGDTRALIPRFDRRGSRGAKQPDKVMLLLAEATADAFKASPAASGLGIHSRLVAKLNAANQSLPTAEHLMAPSLRTTYRLLKRADAYEMVVLRDGKASADRRFRVVKAGVRTSRILQIVEIDHTPLDLFLIDERTWLPLGRPTLTMLLDKHSRMPLGYYLSYGAPSAAAVVGAMRHAILPKIVGGNALPNLVIDNDWPCYGIPEILVVDNGLEFHGIDLAGIANDMGMTIQFCPKREPRFKGAVERYLKTINYHFAHQLPGTSLARFHLRGDYDPLAHSLITFGEFKQIFEKWLLDIYAATVHRGIGTTPRALWSQGLAVCTPELPESTALLQRRFGQNTARRVRKSGFELNGIRYSDETLLPVLRRYGEGVQVRVVFDPEDLGTVQVWGPDDTDPVPVRAVDYEYAKGLTVRQNDLIRQLVREAGEEAQDLQAVHRARQALVTEVEALMTSRKLKARQRSAAIRGISSSKPEQPEALVASSAPKNEAKPSNARAEVAAEVKSPIPLPAILEAFEMLPVRRLDEAD